MNTAVMTAGAAGVIRLYRIDRSMSTEAISEPTALIGCGPQSLARRRRQAGLTPASDIHRFSIVYAVDALTR